MRVLALLGFCFTVFGCPDAPTTTVPTNQVPDGASTTDGTGDATAPGDTSPVPDATPTPDTPTPDTPTPDTPTPDTPAPDAVPDVPTPPDNGAGDATPDQGSVDTTPDVPPPSGPSGDTCEDAFVVDALPFSATGTTAGQTDDYDSTACTSQINPPVGGGSPDVVFAFTPQATGYYTADLLNWSNNPPYLLIATSDCSGAAGPSACAGVVDVQSNFMTTVLQAGVTYYFIVDNVTSETGAYEFTLEEECIPDCTGLSCGEESFCELPCGTCEPSEGCNAGACVDASGTLGDTCANPKDMGALPATVSGDTSAGLTNANTWLPGSCGNLSNIFLGAAAADEVWQFDATESAQYTITLGSNQDLGFYVFSDCSEPNATCSAGVDNEYGGNDEVLQVALEPGTYFIAVDGYTGSDEGSYSLSVSGPCTPDCSGKVCGDDGCGGTCGAPCGAGQVCNAAQDACEALGGDSCANPIVIGALPFEQQGDTSTATNVLSLADGACDTSGWGAGSSERIFEFTPTVTGYYDIKGEGVNFDEALYITTSCVDGVVADCVAASDPGEISTLLDAGTTYYIVMDGWSGSFNDAGNYVVSVSEPCLPDCDGKTCGDDGCGNSCGECAQGTTCNGPQDACIPVPGNTCNDPVAIGALPFSATANTSEANNNLLLEDGACGTSGWGAGSNDIVYRFTPPETAYYPIDVEAGFDEVLYIATSCGDVTAEACIDASDPGNLTVLLEATTTYFIVVDGWSDSSNDAGTYTLTVGAASCVPSCDGKVCGDDGCGGACGSCPAGQACDAAGACYDVPNDACQTATAITVGNLVTGDTSAADISDDYSVSAGQCASGVSAGNGAPDMAYAFSPPATGPYTFTVTPTGGWWASVYVTRACDDLDGTCQAADLSASSDAPASVTVSLDASSTYYVIVDGEFSSDTGAFDLSVEACIPDCAGKACGSDGCGGTCAPGCGPLDYCDESFACATAPDGNSCSNPFVIDALPYQATGDTTGVPNTYATLTGACGDNSGYGDEAGDLVYAFTPATSAYYTVTLDASYDEALYIVTDCSDLVGTCLESSDPGSIEDIFLTAATTYYIVVDGWTSGEGTFTLDVVLSCTPSCDGKTCGTDGCGGSCGDPCQAGQTCDNGTCVAESGDTCQDALVIDPAALPYEVIGDTSTATDAYSTPEDSCGPSAYGVAAPERVHRFTPAQTGLYTVDMNGIDGWDELVYVTSDCTTIDAQTCLGFGDFGPVEVLLEQGTTYFIVADGYNTGDEGPYSLTVSEPCIPDCSAQQCGVEPVCGTPCGECSGDTYCDTSNACSPLPPGNTCNDFAVLNYAGGTGSVSGTTEFFTGDFTADACADADFFVGSGSNDAIHQFTAPTAGLYDFQLTLDVTNFDALLYVLDGPTCSPSAACLGSDDTYENGGETLQVTLAAGQVVWVVVDGYSNSSNASGLFELTVTGP